MAKPRRNICSDVLFQIFCVSVFLHKLMLLSDFNVRIGFSVSQSSGWNPPNHLWRFFSYKKAIFFLRLRCPLEDPKLYASPCFRRDFRRLWASLAYTVGEVLGTLSVLWPHRLFATMYHRHKETFIANCATALSTTSASFGKPDTAPRL